MDRHSEFVDPVGKDPLDLFLPKSETIGMASGKAAERSNWTPANPMIPALSAPRREEPIGNPALIENLESPRMEAARA